jgi:hypothetical protein
MDNETATYLMEKGIDPDVFFTNGDGPIAPNMREDWIADHKIAVANSDINYDNTTGYYNFTMRIPDEMAKNYIEDKEKARAVYAKHPQVNLLFNSSGVYLTGSVQTPGTAVLLSKLVNATPQAIRQ